jgi:tetratricopeptide (TPR) repeat protein
MKSMRLLLAIVVAMMTMVEGYSQNDPLKNGQFLIKEEQYNKAIEALNSAPESTQKSELLGEVYFKIGQNDLALAAFQKAAANPESFKGLCGLAALDLKNGDKAKAVLAFDKIIKSNKKNNDAYASVIEYCLAQSTPDTALANKYLAMALKLNFKSPVFHVLHGDINSIAGKYGPAANDYERAYFYDAKYTEAYRKVGVIYTRSKIYKQALEAFNKCIEIDGSQILVYKNLGDLYYMFGKYSDAETAYKTYIDRAESNADDTERYAFTLFYTKKYDEANALLDKLIGKSKSETVIYRLKGYMANETKDYATSVNYLEKFFEGHDPSRIIISDYTYYARSLSNVDKDSLAEIIYEKAIALDTTSVELLEELAKIYSRDKKQDKAIETYRRLIANGRDASTMNFNIGREYYFKGDAIRYDYTKKLEALKNVSNPELDSMKVLMANEFVNSRAAFTESAKLSPNFATTFLYLGRIESILDPESLGTGAKENYEKAMAILEAGDQTKNKKSLLECYRSLGSYYYFNSERAKGADATQMKTTSKTFFEKILAIDPKDAQALQVMEALKN